MFVSDPSMYRSHLYQFKVAYQIILVYFDTSFH